MQSTITQFDHAFKALCASLLEYKDQLIGPQTPFYIWRTRGDGRVRASHAANDGKVFDRNNPPPTGNPGQDYGCRCWAEPVGGDVYVEQVLISKVDDAFWLWTNAEFVSHYVLGGGEAVRLQDTGYLAQIIQHYSKTLNIYDRVNRQIIAHAITFADGACSYEFKGSYPFGSIFTGVKFSFGHSTVKGRFDGEIHRQKGFAIISGDITYDYDDMFTDPFDKVERLMANEGISRQEAEARVGASGDAYGTSYRVFDQWRTKFNATVNDVKHPK
jgi:hypothetical protein